MPAKDLSVCLIQHPLVWEAPADNRRQFEHRVRENAGADVFVLPEMFTTGFSMNAIGNAESPGGDTTRWMQDIAREMDCAITGSIATRVGEVVFNRMLFVTPDAVTVYDKRHLFRMAGEHKRYAAGHQRVVTEWRGWRILLQVCYDLRFPVFSRNQNDYDLAIYVANWPAPRALHWRSLLQARAIENLSAVVGVNRIGADANGLDYRGDSLAIAANGDLLTDLGDREICQTVLIKAEEQNRYRERFPAFLDADGFELIL